MFYFHHTPRIIQWMYGGLMWHADRNQRNVYLTFDDGPVPDATPAVLDILAEYNVKATFFCVGDNVRKYPEIMDRILKEGHRAGNHTFNHLNGWAVKDDVYFKNIERCDEILLEHGVTDPPFRPPYGRISGSQVRKISKYRKIVMWDVLTGDFDSKQSAESCFRKTAGYIRNGSVIVLHDNPKAMLRTLPLLPKLIQHIKSNHWECSLL